MDHTDETGTAKIIRHQYAVIRHLMETLVFALVASSGVMFLAMVAIAMVTDDFPGRWLIAVAGTLAAAGTIQSQVDRIPWRSAD